MKTIGFGAIAAALTVSVLATLSSTALAQVADKWSLWSGDTPQLRGANVFQRRVYPDLDDGYIGPRAVGSLPGLTAFGAYDMAGNVRENGFRCAFYPEPEKIPDAAFERIELRATRDFYAETPVPDEIFRVFKERFSYDRTDLDARVDSRQEGNEHWIHETVSYDAAYGEERILAHLFLPRSASPPYQTVIYFPASGSVFQRSSAQIEGYLEFTRYLSFIVKNGRAVIYPVYKGTFERHDPTLIAIHGGEGSHRYTEYLVQLVKDSMRSIDYLETRDDIAPGKLAYLGVGWGGALGAIIPAVEDRFQASVLIAGGLPARGAQGAASLRDGPRSAHQRDHQRHAVVARPPPGPGGWAELMVARTSPEPGRLG